MRQKSKSRRAALCLLSGLCGVLAGTSGHAADAAASDENLSDIVVTALRREQRLQDAPAAITVLSGDALERKGVSNFYDYYRSVPGLQITDNPVTPGQARISLRGIYAAGESTTGLYYGETPVTGPSGTSQDAGWQTPNLETFDVERVEVLKGPQGTLYGSSSVGGTIRVNFAKPDPTRFGGKVDVEGSTTEDGASGGHVRAALNLPLIENQLAARIVGYREQTAGYVDNFRTGENNINGGSVKGGRFSLAYTPNENIDLAVLAVYQKKAYDDAATWFQQFGEKAYNTDAAVKVPYNDDFRLFNGTLNWTFPFAKLTAVSSYYEWNFVREADATGSFYGAINGATAASLGCERYTGITAPCSPGQLAAYKAYGYSVLPGSLHTPVKFKAYSDELRLASLGGGWIDWTVGLFYEHRKDHSDSYLSKADAATGALLEPLVNNGYRVVDNDLSQFSQFGEVSVRPVKNLTITGGIRHYDYDKDNSGQVLQNGYIYGSFVGPETDQKASKSGDVGKFGASYRFADSVLGYATWAQGFRPGGANNVPGLTAAQSSYQPDSLNSYEVGLKTNWFDNDLTLNVAAYQINWSNVQSTLTVLPAFRITTNAGAARIRGLEVEAAARPLRGLFLTGGINYVPTAELTEGQTGGNIIVGPQNGLKGDRIPYTPKLTLSSAADYSWLLYDGLGAFVGADAAYRSWSAEEFRPTNPVYEVLHSFTELNARVGLARNGWTGKLFVNNLTNVAGQLSVNTLIVGAPYQQKRMLGTLAPRTIGINLTKEF